MKALLALIAKLYGKGAISKTIGSRTNVIKLADNDAKRFIKNELNIEAAGEAAIQKGLKDAESLIADIPKMNDQEILTFTGNLKRLDQKVNPPQAEVLDITTQQKVSPEGIASLTETVGQVSPPGTMMGNIESKINKLKSTVKNMDSGTTMDDVVSDALQSQKKFKSLQDQGLVTAASREILQRDVKSGVLKLPKEIEDRIMLVDGDPGRVDPIEIFRTNYGEDALEQVDSLIPDLAKAQSYKDLLKVVDRNYTMKPRTSAFPETISPEDAAKAEDEFGIKSLKDDIDDPEGFAMGGRVSYAYGSGLKLIQLLNKAKKSLKQAIKESADDIIPTGDSKLDADMAVDNLLEKLGVDREAVDGYDILDAYGEAYKTITKPKVYGKYKFTGKESMNDLYELERLGKITRDDMNVYDPRYKEYLDAQIINEEKLYTRKEWEKTPETIKNKTRGRIDPDWEEANFGEDYDFDQVRGKELEEGTVTRPKVLQGGIGSLSDEEGMEMMNALYPDGKIKIGGQELDLSDIANDVKLMNEKGLRGNKAGDYDKFVEMQLSGELGPQQQMKTIKMELRNRYSRYLDDETMDVIQESNDPQKVAEVYANVREAALLSDRGVPTEEIVDTIIKTPRTKQAEGTGPQGLDYLMGVERKNFGWGSEDTYGGGYSEAEANAASVDTSQDSSYGGSETSEGYDPYENDSWGMPGSSQAMKDAVDAIGGYDPSDGISGYDDYNYRERLNQQRGISNAQYGMFNYAPSIMALDALRAISPYGQYSTTGPSAITVEGEDISNIPLTQNQSNTSLINDSSLYTPEQIDYRLFESSKNPFYSLRPNINSGGRIGYAEGSKPKGIKYLLGY